MFQYFRIKLVFWSLLLVLGAFFFYALKFLFFPILLGFLFALLLQPAVERLESLFRSRVVSIMAVFGSFLMLLTALLLLIVPRLFYEINSFNQNKEYYIQKSLKAYKKVKKTTEKRYAKMLPWKEVEEAIKHPRFLSARLFLNIPKLLGNSLEMLISFLFIPPLFAFFMLKDGPSLKKNLIRFVPNRYFELTLELFHNTNQQIIAFIRGQTLDSILNATFLSIALSFAGLHYAILIGCFGGLANAVPVIGPIVAGSLGILIALLTQSANPFLIFAIFAIIHLIDVMFIYPHTVGHSLQVHEFVVIIGVIVGGHLGGIIGMFLAVPTLGILMRSLQIMHKTLTGYRIL